MRLRLCPKRLTVLGWAGLACAWLTLTFVAQAAEDSSASVVRLAKIFAGATPTDVTDLKAMEQHIQRLTATIVRCTVAVRVGPAQGSGVIVSQDGYVLTAAHVIGRPDRPATLVFSDGRMVRGKTLGVNRGIDSALIKITDEGPWPYVEMGNSAKLNDGQWVLGTGHPEGYQHGRKPVLRLGRVLANHSSAIVTDCVLVSGDSGGPLFDMAGKVVGIHSRIGGPLTANLHVPVQTYNDTWERLAKGEQWGYFPGEGPYIGVQGDPESDDAKIVEVFRGTPAAQAGLKPGDVITRFDGQAVQRFDDLVELIGSTSPGDKVRLELKRGPETLTLEIVIGRRGPS